MGPEKGKRWQPPEGLSPADVRAIIAAANDRDRLLLRVLWATGGRISEALALRACDIRRDALVLPNRKNPSRPVKTVFLAGGDLDLPGELLLRQKQQGLGDDEPHLFSRKRGTDGSKRAISCVQAWKIVKEASARARIRVLATRPSQRGDAGASPPLLACPGPPARAPDEEPAADPVAGGLGPIADGVPHHRRRRGAS